MCGIHFQAWSRQDTDDEDVNGSNCRFCYEASSFENYYSTSNLYRRGPNAQNSVIIQSPKKKKNDNNDDDDNDDYQNGSFSKIELHASVLQMRQDLVQQPVSISIQQSQEQGQKEEEEEEEQQQQQQERNKNDDSDDKNKNNNNNKGSNNDIIYLCWNGEIYQTTNNDKAWEYNLSDTELVANQIQQAYQNVMIQQQIFNDDHTTTSSTISTITAMGRKIAQIMSQFYNAEFAFVIVTPIAIYYGRDSWGRRSLLRWDCPNRNIKNCKSFQIVSVAEELILQKNSNQNQQNEQPIPNNNEEEDPPPASTPPSSSSSDGEWQEIIPGMVHISPLVVLDHGNDTSLTSIDSIRYPTTTIPTSHSMDAHTFTTTTLFTSSSSSSTNTTTKPENVSNELWEASLELEYHLTRAIQMRMDHSISTSTLTSTQRSTAVLFSGGLDSAVVAAIAARLVTKNNNSNDNNNHNPDEIQSQPPLLLYNVSFGPSYEKSADRKAALISYQTMKDANYNVQFQDIIVDWDDICQWEPHIRTLIQPKTTLMDINIAAALWFASRGEGGGQQQQQGGGEETTTPSPHSHSPSPRVLLLGMGADEQLGGYGRHRKAFERGGMAELQKELQYDQERFWERNLGRDDRICSDHGKEARFPFLDYHVVQFLQKHSQIVSDFSLPPGQGDKRLLRLVALRLGLDHASGLVKRAIQFGSRISHLSDAKRFGSRRKAKGESAIGDSGGGRRSGHGSATAGRLKKKK